MNSKVLLENTRKIKPIVHHITNYVTVNDCANVTLAIGASPIMADSIEEVEEITSISNSLLINIGTINERLYKSMLKSGKKANEKNIPVILDPVGVGASSFRKKITLDILKNVKVSIIKGNASEIAFIGNISSKNQGVDSDPTLDNQSLDTLIDIAKTTANITDCIIAMTGKTDIITDGKKTYLIKNGIEELGLVTGTGCMTASIVSSLAAANKTSLLEAAALGVLIMALSGEISLDSLRCRGLGEFRCELINTIGNINYNIINNNKDVEYLNE